MEKINNIIKESGLYLLILMLLNLIITSIFYIFKIPLTKFNFIFSLLITTLIIFIKNKDKKVFSKTLVLSLIVLVISIGISSFIYDRSSDGNTYHKDAIATLYSGWNPVYNSSSNFNKNDIDNYDMHAYDIWKDHYAKANWILEANVYKLTDNIESGKAINFIFMYILFAISYTYFYSKLGKRSIILSLIITFNPVVCNQLYTFYNDQLGASLLFILIISLIKVIDNQDNDNIILKFTYLLSSFILITNIKFNNMGYGLVYTFIFMIFYLIMKYKKGNLIKSLKKLVPLYIFVFIISFILIGYPTYIKNYIDHGNLFYPIYGKDKVDIITKQQPANFINKSSIEKNIISLFSRTNNLRAGRKLEYKIPFTFKIYELKESMSIDPRINGFGVLSSGLFIISIIVICLYFNKCNNIEKNIIITLITTTLLLLVVISESWWARYSPQNYIFIPISIYLLLKYSKVKLKYLFIALVFINSFIILSGNTYYSFKESIKIHNDLSELKNKKIVINFNNGDMTGVLYNLNDYKIKYNFTDKKLENITYYKYLNYEVIK